MDENGFGAYKPYFRVLRYFGTFPFRTAYGNAMDVHHGGPWKWFYYINFVMVVFSAAFQFCQLFLTILYAPIPAHVIGQLCWQFAICLPLANYVFYIRREDRIARSINSWGQLERTIIGSTLRNFGSSMTSGPMPSISNCHLAQRQLFRKANWIYLALAILAFTGITVHVYSFPRFPAYIYSAYVGVDENIMYASIGYQIWLTVLIITHVYATEVIMIIMSGSIYHCIETLCYRASVVMSKRQCDMPQLDHVLIKNWAAFEAKNKESVKMARPTMLQVAPMGMGMGGIVDVTDNEKKENGQTGTTPAGEGDTLAHVVQNVVDIQYALDRFKDIEAVVDSINNSFGRILFSHQSVYMAMMCCLMYTPIRYYRILPLEGCLLLICLSVYYGVRLFMFYPSMGRINRLSFTFVESWKEGLRHIPKGKYAYEFYMHKLDCCRKLAFDAGGFYIMQKGTVLTFVSIVTTHVIVLLQLY